MTIHFIRAISLLFAPTLFSYQTNCLIFRHKLFKKIIILSDRLQLSYCNIFSCQKYRVKEQGTADAGKKKKKKISLYNCRLITEFSTFRNWVSSNHTHVKIQVLVLHNMFTECKDNKIAKKSNSKNKPREIFDL